MGHPRHAGAPGVLRPSPGIAEAGGLSRMKDLVAIAFVASGLVCPLLAEDFQGSAHTMPYDDEVIGYSAHTPTDRIAKLQARIASGEVKLKWDEKFGWLPALLDELKV